MAYGPFLDSPGGSGHRPRRLLWLVMLTLLVVVLFFVFKILPQPTEILSDRQARKRLVEAARLEEQSLNLYAAEIYSRIVDSARVTGDLRFQAARGLARASRATGHLETVEAALEKAYAFSRPGPEQVAVRDELERLRGRPLGAAADARTSSVQALEFPPTLADLNPPAAPAAAPDRDPYPLPVGAQLLARIGGEQVSMGEIMYAWKRFNGYRQPPTAEELTPFVKFYLDLVLLADEARRSGLDRQPDTLYDLRVQRVLGLNQALNEKMVRDLQTPDPAALEEYYRAHKELFTTPARASIGQILVGDDGDVGIVKKALAQGQSFAKVAQKYSRDADQLKDGYILGEISENDPGIPGFGPNPSLVRRLMALSDGATTGPIRTPRGLHLLQVFQKTPPSLRPFAEVQESVLLSYQKQQLAAAKQSLFQQLHRERPFEIEDPALRRVVLEAQEATSATTATAAAAPPPPAMPVSSITSTSSSTTTPDTPPKATPKKSGKKSAKSSSGKKSGGDR